MIRIWLASKIITLGLWVLGYRYREMRGLELLLEEVRAYRKRLEAHS